MQTRRQRVSKLALGLGAIVAACGVLVFPVSTRPAPAKAAKGHAIDLSAFSDEPPATPIDLLFIHHSCGGQWLADPGREEGERASCIVERHPNGGELRARLRANHYVVHEASYGSRIGEKTDLFDWLPKFRDEMSTILAVDENDRLMSGRTNRIVVFKSCFPNSNFVGRGSEPGDAAGPSLTLANARATMNALLPELAKHPEVLFVYVTAPPIVGDGTAPVWKYALRSVKRTIDGHLAPDESGAIAREFNDWVKSPDGWLSHYAPTNVAVFDLFDVLTDDGKSNVLVYPSGKDDSHSTSVGNLAATRTFVPFLNRTFHRATFDVTAM